MTHRAALGRATGTALLAAAAAVLAAAPAGAAAKGMQTARFHATVSGTQKTTWTMDHTRYDGCIGGETRTTGAGTEEIAFKSTRRAPLDFLKIGADVVASPGVAGLPVRGTVRRDGATRLEQLSGGESFCGGTDKAEDPPAPDCGERSWRGTVSPVVYAPADYPGRDLLVPLLPVLSLTGPTLRDDRTFNDLFRNCPGADGQLAPTPNSSFVRSRIYSKAKRVVIRGSDTVTESNDGYRTTVRITWRAVLVRRAATTHTPAKRAGGRSQ